MPDNPESKLKDKKEEFKKSEANLTKYSKEKESLNAEVAALEKVVSTISHASEAYGQAYKNIKDAAEKIEIYCHTKKKMIEAVIKGKKQDIKKKEDEVDSPIGQMGEVEKKLKDDLIKLEGEYRDATQEYEKTRDDYDSSITLKRKIDDRLRELKDLKASIAKEEESNNIAGMSFLLSEMDKVLVNMKPDIKAKGKFKQELLKKWEAMDAAKTALRDKEEQLRKAKEALEEKHRELETLTSTRRKAILDRLA